MNHFMLSSPERIQSWGQFRDGLPTVDEETQLNNVAKFWALCPFAKWTVDPDAPKTWPSVWEMLHHGDYCKNAIAIGMEATLRLSGWAPERLKLTMVKNLVDCEEFLTLIIDANQVLNYSYAEVIGVEDLTDEVETQQAYRWNGRAYELVS
jgi:hypothetical protein